MASTRLTPRHVRLARASLACVGVASVAGLGACGTQNATNTLSGAGDDPLPALVPNPPTSLPSQPAPSVTGLDRRNWPMTRVEVARGQVEVQPTYSENLSLSKGTARDTGSYPTTATALDGRSDGGSVLAEAAAQPGWTAGLVMVGGPIRMVLGQPPWTVERDPAADFAMQPDSMSSGNQRMWEWVNAPSASSAPLPTQASVGVIRERPAVRPMTPAPPAGRAEPPLSIP